MFKKATKLIAICMPLIMGCQPKNTETKMDIQDPHSEASNSTVIPDKLNLDLTIDFSTKQLRGFAKWEWDSAINGNLILDTRDLTIEKVFSGDSENEISFTLNTEKPFLGSALQIPITDKYNSIRILYSTSQNAEAIQWFDKEQTLGGKQPFMFTQSQAILARTWIPCPDGPGFRFTYDAKITVPKGMMALMSAENPQALSPDGVYTFKQPKPVPAYLMALSAGNIAFKSVGERTGVYAEPEMLEKAAWEFSEMNAMLEAAENLYGKYAWGRYDLLVLPASFPFGGMENPCLTFATPTVIAGDKSLTSLVAHELAHSWSGNLVTNATWNDFWLNEGFTVYFERRIMEVLNGKPYAEMLEYLGYQDLMDDLKSFGPNNKDSQLKLDLDGRNPDDGMNNIAYEKGYFLLKQIEAAVGRDKFDEFLKQYFSENAFKVMDTEHFLVYLKNNLPELTAEKWAKINIERWIYKPDLPQDFNLPKCSLFEKVDLYRTLFLSNPALSKAETKNWSSHEWLYFIRGLDRKSTSNQLASIDKAFNFTKTGNAELAAAWFELAIYVGYEKAYPNMETFLAKVGRRKFVKPLFEALIKADTTKKWAKEIYKGTRNSYHAVTKNTIDGLLGIKIP